MIRLVILLAVLCALAFGAALLADDPGTLHLELFGHVVDTTGFVAIGALIAVAALAVLAFVVLRWLWLTPARTARMMQRRRNKKGFDAISRGIVAIGAGDLRAAERQAVEAERIAPNEPLTLLLRAQTSQLGGDRDGAEKAFRAMLAKSDTKVLGLRGLYIEAQRRQDVPALKAIAEEAVKVSPSASWAANALLEHHAMTGNWSEALTAVERNATAGLISREQSRRSRAVLLTKQALEAEEKDADAARALALEANKLAPDLVPAAALLGRLHGARGDLRKASKVIETAWASAPHPDLASVYAALRPGDSTRDRLKRVKYLAGASADPEAALAIARAAVDAHEWDDARRALSPLVASAPTQRVCLLMAEIATRQDNDAARAREWMAKALRAPRDPAWTADGHVSDHWLPASPVTGKLDAFQWKVPLEQLGGPMLYVDDVLADGAEAEVEAPRILPPPALPVKAAEAAEPTKAPEAAKTTAPVLIVPTQVEAKPTEVKPTPPVEVKPVADAAKAAAAGATPWRNGAAPAPAKAEAPAPARAETAATELKPSMPWQKTDSAPVRSAPMPTVFPLERAPDDPGPVAEPAASRKGGFSLFRGPS